MDNRTLLTLKEFKKLTAKVPDDFIIEVPSYCSNGYFVLSTDMVKVCKKQKRIRIE